MCIIIYKRKKLDMPSLDILENCFENNPNGAGFMYRVDNKIHISKGYMTYDKLIEALLKVQETVNLKRTDLVIHFRISTTGSSVPENCHPFPLSNKIADLKALNIECNRAIAHNGILEGYAGFHSKDTDLSDTAYFAKMLSGVNDRFVEAVIDQHSLTSRFVYMSGRGKVIVFGMTKIPDGDGKGLWVSNNTYLYQEPIQTRMYAYDIATRYQGEDNFWYGWEGKNLEAKEEAWQEWQKANPSYAKAMAASTNATLPATIVGDDDKETPTPFTKIPLCAHQPKFMTEAECEIERARRNRLRTIDNPATTFEKQRKLEEEQIDAFNRACRWEEEEEDEWNACDNITKEIAAIQKRTDLTYTERQGLMQKVLLDHNEKVMATTPEDAEKAKRDAERKEFVKYLENNAYFEGRY